MTITDKIDHSRTRLMEVGMTPTRLRLNSNDRKVLIAEITAGSPLFPVYGVPEHEQYLGMKIVVDDTLPDGDVLVEG